MANGMYVVSNWKMNVSPSEARGLLSGMTKAKTDQVTRIVLPPFPLLPVARDTLDHMHDNAQIALGGQDCHAESHGAYTGDVSSRMLKNAGCRYVLLGHSERRQHHDETSHDVAKKVKAASEAGLRVILCVGESDGIRQKGDDVATAHVAEQLTESLEDVTIKAKSLIVAYEPVWAIGTGKIPNAKQIESMHLACREALIKIDEKLATCPILYGGSVNTGNAKEIAGIPGVDGVLVGGASLKAGAINAISRASQIVKNGRIGQATRIRPSTKPLMRLGANGRTRQSARDAA
ncbi:MAG: triose-phosphate isomerase [Proteobacteria bacterium]|nr:triose-phosphate isomerase [Pseudomonadota bacterium]